MQDPEVMEYMESTSKEALEEKVRVLKEQVSSQEDMLRRTTDYMTSIQGKLERSKAEVETKNEEINQSLRYAQRLQNSIRPDVSRLQQAFNGAFIHLKQADFIGGDLAYSRQTDDGYYIAAVDCTGHGIPGAMLSMMAFSYLDEIILHQNVNTPGEILTKLNKMVLDTLRARNEDVKDGMDMALIRICLHKKQVLYSGARRPLIYIPNGKIEQIPGTRKSIGEYSDMSYEDHTLDLREGMKLYIFSDGITDQFGGPKDKKFGKKRLLKLLGAIKDLNMIKQDEIIGNTLESWQGDQTQTDDQILIGIKI